MIARAAWKDAAKKLAALCSIHAAKRDAIQQNHAAWKQPLIIKNIKQMAGWAYRQKLGDDDTFILMAFVHNSCFFEYWARVYVYNDLSQGLSRLRF